jgi:hypothetical protein
VRADWAGVMGGNPFVDSNAPSSPFQPTTAPPLIHARTRPSLPFFPHRCPSHPPRSSGSGTASKASCPARARHSVARCRCRNTLTPGCSPRVPPPHPPFRTGLCLRTRGSPLATPRPTHPFHAHPSSPLNPVRSCLPSHPASAQPDQRCHPARLGGARVAVRAHRVSRHPLPERTHHSAAEQIPAAVVGMHGGEGTRLRKPTRQQAHSPHHPPRPPTRLPPPAC